LTSAAGATTLLPRFAEAAFVAFFAASSGSMIAAAGAFFCIALIPLIHAALFSYAWLAAMTSPLLALRWNRYYFFRSRKISNFAAM
jgi:hypothetical protein